MIHRSPWRFIAPLLALCVTGLAFGRNDAADLVVLGTWFQGIQVYGRPAP
jgi:hypothetical protein